MHHSIRLRFSNRPADHRAVGEIALKEFGPRFDRFAMAFGQVVEDRHLVAFIEQLLDTNASDVACSASYKNRLHGKANAICKRPDNQ